MRPAASPISVPTQEANVPEELPQQQPAPEPATVTAPPAPLDCRAKMLMLGVISNGPCVDVSDIVEHLATGTYSFNKPDSAYVDVPFHIALALKTTSKQDVSQVLEGLPGQVTERTGKFAQSLEAQLHGDDMLVDPAGMLARTATMVEPVTWEWTVTPKAGGKKTLVIEVVANIQTGPDNHKVQIKTLREPIQIYVSGFQQMKAYLAEANGFLLALGAAIPALGAIVGLVPPIRRVVVRWWKLLSKRQEPA